MGNWSWKRWTVVGLAAAWVLLVVAMLVSEDVLMAVGWLTPIGLLLLAGAAVVVAAAVKYLRQDGPNGPAGQS